MGILALFTLWFAVVLLMYVETVCFGAPVKARVEAVRLFHSSHAGPTFELFYSYTLHDETYSGERSLNDGDERHLRAGQEVDMLVGWAVIPLISDRNGLNYLITPLAFFAVGLVFFGVFGYAMVGEDWRQQALLHRGAVGHGELLDIETTEKGPVAKYRFESASGERVEDIMFVRPADVSRLSKERPLTILYDERRPTDNMIYEAANFEVGA